MIQNQNIKDNFNFTNRDSSLYNYNRFSMSITTYLSKPISHVNCKSSIFLEDCDETEKLDVILELKD